MSLLVAIALACTPAPGFLELTWTSECLVITANGPYGPSDSGFPTQELFLGFVRSGYDLYLTNLCDEPIELVDDCDTTRCPFDLQLDPGETADLALPAAMSAGEVPRYVSVFEADEERVLTVINKGEPKEDCDVFWCGCQTATPTNLLSWLRRRR